jgi:hypothetical protein
MKKKSENTQTQSPYQLYILCIYWCATRFPYHIMFVSFDSNTTGVTNGAGTTNFSEPLEFIWCLRFYYPCFSAFRVVQHLVFCVVFCKSLFVLLAIVFSILLWFTASGYPVFGIFKLFLRMLIAIACWNWYNSMLKLVQ